jgi:PAS domain S-box-containing protein
MRHGRAAFSGTAAYLLVLSGVGIAYFVLAKGGLTLASINPSATPIWPPSGIALAAVLLWGRAVSPAILVAAFAANVTTAGTVETSAAIALGNTFEAIVGAWLVKRYSGGRHTFDRPTGVLRFGLICSVAAAPVSATIGVMSLVVAGFAQWNAFLPIWLTWWLGDLGGMLLVTPAILLWLGGDAPRLDRQALLRLAAPCVAAVAIGLFAFSPVVELNVDRAPLGFIATVPLVWAALWQNQRDTATVALILAGFAVWGTASDGVLPDTPLNQSFLLLVALIIGMTLPSLALSADAMLRKRAEDLLRRAHEGEVETRKRIEVELSADFAKRERVQRELAAVERRFRLLVQGVTDYAIVMLNRDGDVSDWNSGAERIKGYSAAEIIGENFNRFYTDEGRAEGEPARALARAEQDGKFESDGWRVRKDGTRFWANAIVHAVCDEDGKLIGFAEVTRDVTEKRDAQIALDEAREQLAQAQKLEALGQLTGGIAHDFNNLLAAIQAGLLLIERNADDKIKLERMIAELRKAAKRGEGVIRQLLSFSRAHPVRSEVVDPATRIKDAAALFGPLLGGGINVIVDVEQPLPSIKVDSGQFELALLNICLNARDAMPNGGTLKIRAWSNGAKVQIAISDTGVGIPDDIKSRVFDPFFTTKEVGKGTGLGLSQAYGFAQQSGGTIAIDSKLGYGTTVSLRLPGHGAPVADTSRDRSTVTDTQHTGRVLLVEDDPVLASLATEALEQMGYGVKTVYSAGDALAALANDDAIDAVFSDIVMPGGINGLALARAIQMRRPGLPILLTTGFYEPAEAAQIPGVEIVPKPYDAADVATRLAGLIGRSGQTAAYDPLTDTAQSSGSSPQPGR